MKPYPHNCQHDYEQELIELDQRNAHLASDCEGAPGCGDCLDAQEQAEAQLRKALEACREWFDDRADVVDGPDGQPMPNEAMRMLAMVRLALGEIG